MTAATGSLSHAATDSFFAFSRRYFRRRPVRPQATADSDADRFSSSAYCMTRIALMKASQPCS
jgi:hypothetical protein